MTTMQGVLTILLNFAQQQLGMTLMRLNRRLLKDILKLLLQVGCIGSGH